MCILLFMDEMHPPPGLARLMMFHTIGGGVNRFNGLYGD